ASSRWALPALVLVTVWAQAGYANLIYLSALQDAPAQLYEAAQIDGAGRWRTFRTITWPSLLPTTIFLLVTLFVGISQTFGMIALITNGGPGDSTTTLSFYMYQTSFQFYRFGYASAVGLVTFLGIFAIMLVMWRAQPGRALNGILVRSPHHRSRQLRRDGLRGPAGAAEAAPTPPPLGLGPPDVAARGAVPAPLRVDDLHLAETRRGRLPRADAVDPRGRPLGELHRSAVRGDLDPALLRELGAGRGDARPGRARDHDARRLRLREAALPRPEQ